MNLWIILQTAPHRGKPPRERESAGRAGGMGQKQGKCSTLTHTLTELGPKIKGEGGGERGAPVIH